MSDDLSQFWLMLAQISARFVRIQADRVDGAIEEVQRLLCEKLGLDRSALWQTSSEEPDVLLVTHLYQNAVGLLVPSPGDGGMQPDGDWILQPAGTPPPYVRVSAETFFPWAFRRLRLGETVVVSNLEDLPDEAARDRTSFRRADTKSSVIVPLSMSGTLLGCLSFASTRENRTWSEELVKQFQFVADLFTNALARKRADQELRAALDEVRHFRDKLSEENVYLRQEVQSFRGHQGIIGQSRALRHVLAQVSQVAATGSTVLLLGETGTGKELIASAIHDLSPRRDRALVHVNCAAIPAALIESELFGREKGAYTGAYARQAGSFELASGSTLLLDEVGELPLEVQAKLLQILQNKKVQRLGSPRTIEVDVRIIAATNQDLEKMVRDGRFREDLFYRLNVFPIHVPPLRERREDIPILVSAFIQEFARAMGKHVQSCSKSDTEALERYPWPGNVRELRNVIERAVILAQGSRLKVELPISSVSASSRSLAMRDAEREHIAKVLDRTGWRVRGKGGAAEILDMKPSTLRSRMVKLGLRRPLAQ